MVRKRNRNKRSTEKFFPCADDLRGYPKLKKRLSKMRQKPHPIDNQNIFSTLLITYISDYLELSDRMVITGKCNFNLPMSDQFKPIATALDIALNKRNNKSGLLMTFLKSHWFSFIWLVTMTVVNSSVDFIKIFAVKMILDLIAESKMDAGLLAWFALFWVSDLFYSITAGWIKIQSFRLMYRLLGSSYYLMAMKSLKVGIVNPQEFDHDSILDIFKYDVSQIEFFSSSLVSFVRGTTQVTLAILFGVYFFGYIFFGLLGAMVIFVLIENLLHGMVRRRDKKANDAKIKRKETLMDVLRNISFIKINALENIFLLKLNRVRRAEIRAINKYRFLQTAVNFILNFKFPLILTGFLFLFFNLGGVLSVSLITLFLRISVLVKKELCSMSNSIGNWSVLKWSLKRIHIFLDSSELEFNRIKSPVDFGDKDGIRIETGNFYWDKQMSREEAEGRRLAKLKGVEYQEDMRTPTKIRNRTPSEISKQSNSILYQTLLTEFTTESMMQQYKIPQKEEKFRLNSFDFRAKRGKLTVVIGKLESGKSTLLHSLLGETMIKNFLNTKVFLNGYVSYMGHTPWMIKGTVLENIVLNKKFIREKFDWALKFSCLDAEMLSWRARENTDIKKLASICQRKRIEFARCLYQS